KLVVRPYALPLDDEAALDKYLAALHFHHGRLKAEGKRIGLVANDTLKRSIGTLDANRNETAAKFSQVFEGIAADLGCAVLVNAHDTWSSGEIGGSKDYTNFVPWSLHTPRRRQEDTAYWDRLSAGAQETHRGADCTLYGRLPASRQQPDPRQLP